MKPMSRASEARLGSGAHWGGRSVGAERGNALWGRKGSSRTVATSIVLAFIFAIQLAFASAAGAARMPKSLRDAIKANPSATYKVILTGSKTTSSSAVDDKVKKSISAYPSTKAKIKKKFTVVNAEAAELTGSELASLDSDPSVASIVPDGTVRSAAGPTGFSNSQSWPNVSEAPGSCWSYTGQTPAIAIVDSGVDTSRVTDFGGRVLTQVSFTTLTPNAGGDGRGHGTFVASIAAGAAPGYAGICPSTPLVSLDVLNDNGEGVLSDVIAAADWIYANRGTYNIRVANFSLTGSVDSSFMYDPLDKAVEKLWFSGVVVVAAAGNYAVDGTPSGIRYAPGNDPFVITVGAADTDGSLNTRDDFNPPWTAYGYTYDGFLKPEIGASGRYMNGAVPVTSTMYTENPARIVGPGYMWMSGTSFAAPVVSAGAAYLLGLYPAWTPDQVKGAIMLKARPVDHAAPNSLGVGEIKIAQASQVTSPPNPNLALDSYVTPDPNGTTPIFDSASWSSAALASASWNSASWSSASWSSASWSSASWSSASWSSASWSSASWSSGSLGDGTLPQASWASGIWVS
jgi:serine protease AprX